jgi:hypothetical protein
MEPAHCWSQKRGGSILFEKGLGGIHAEVREIVLATLFALTGDGWANSLRIIRKLAEGVAKGWGDDERGEQRTTRGI